MGKRKYKYVYVAYTDNLCWGRMKLGEGRTYNEAVWIAESANKGCYDIRKERRYL